MTKLTVKDAKAIIESIRAENGLAAESERLKADPEYLQERAATRSLRTNLIQALQKLSTDLYKKDTHFVLEIIQNADDNTYAEDVEPTLAFDFGQGDSYISCNENGFSEANVRALCRIGQSTKSAQGYIGEKGIGFKSIFKVANKVQVSSPPFAFELDKTAELGMITPVWDVHQKARRRAAGHRAQTMFFLELADKDKQKRIQKDLEALDPFLLLFLRRLKKIKIWTDKITISLNAEATTYSDEEEDEDDESAENDGIPNVERVVVTKQDASGNVEDQDTCFVARRTLTVLPTEEKRPNVESSEIVLAFPVTEQGTPRECYQKVYAFLPLEQIGFRFLVQADFLLTSNRANVLDLDDSSWNATLTEGLVELFADVFEHQFVCQSSLGLEYTWMRFLREADDVSTYWQDSFSTKMGDGILEALRKRPVLESIEGILKRPDQVMIVPSTFRDRDDRALMSIGNDLSLRYQETDWPIIRKLGTDLFDTDKLLRVLQMTRIRKDWFADKSFHWHEDLANALLIVWPESISTRSRNKDENVQPMTSIQINKLKQVKMIALREACWISADAGPVYFDSVSSAVQIPLDVKLQIVNNWPTRSPTIRKLYKRLGVQNLKTKSVAEAILGIYKVTTRKNVTLEHSVEHVQYLYDANITEGFEDIFLFDSHGDKAEIDTLYLDVAPENPNSLTKLFGVDQTSIRFVHPSYVDLGKSLSEVESSKFHAWLRTSFGIATILRFRQGAGLSSDFRRLTRSTGQLGVLSVLRDNWKSYRPHYSQYPNIRKSISTWKWNCINNAGMRPFSETCLPLKRLKDVANEFGPTVVFPFLNVPIPLALGVLTKEGLHFLIWVLREIRRSGEEWTHEKAVALYTRIAAHEDIKSLPKDVFHEHRLIYVQGQWKGPEDCVWAAPQCLERKPALQPEYSGLASLFQDRLRIGNATSQMLLEELYETNLSRHPLENHHKVIGRAASLILEIGHRLHKESPEFQQHLKTALELFEYLPVRHPGSSGVKLELIEFAKFFVADRKYLYDQFKDRVPMLDFTLEEIHSIGFMIKLLGLDNNRLSVAVKTTTSVSGPQEIQNSLTTELQKKGLAFYRIAYHYKCEWTLTSPMRLLRVLQGISVYGVGPGGITTTRVLEHDSVPHSISTKEGILLEESDDQLKVYLPLDKVELEIAYSYYLPNEMVGFLNLSNEQHAIISAVLHASHENLDRVLDLEGIISRDAIERELGCSFSLEKDSSIVPSLAMSRLDLEPNQRELGETGEELDTVLVAEAQGAVASEAIESQLARLAIAQQPPVPTRTTSVSPKTTTRAGSDSATDSSGSDDDASLALLPQQNTTVKTMPFARPTVADIESTTSGLSTRIDIIARCAQRAGLAASTVISLAEAQRENSEEDDAELPSILPSTPSRPAVNAYAGQISNRSGRTSKSSRSNVRNDAQRVRDFSIGFQGELFVFELLKSYLPSFTKANWTSGLREYARAHPDYVNITNYTAREKSDITYDDTEGKLTQFFLDKGLLQVESWLAAPPTYYLEVKTTTEEYDIPFYMSKGQHKLAKALVVVEGQVPSEVYVVMRVSRIQEDPALTIYLDPWGLCLSEKLIFVAESYAVTPGRGGI